MTYNYTAVPTRTVWFGYTVVQIVMSPALECPGCYTQSAFEVVDKYAWCAFGDDIYVATTAALHILRLVAAGVDIYNPSTLPAPVLCAAGCLEIPPGVLSECKIYEGVDVIFS